MSIPAPEIDPRNALLIAERNAAFSHACVATGSPTLWEAPGLPSGATINASTGVIEWTPTVAGIFPFILKASNYDARTVTADAGANTLTANGHAFIDGDLVTLTTTGTLPSPLTTSDTYEVRDVSGSTLKLAATVGGAAIDITTTGTGVHTLRKKQTSEATVLLVSMESSSTVEAGDISIEIDVDLVTGKVTVIGAEGAEWGPPIEEPRNEGKKRATLAAKSGDRFPVAIGFTRAGVLQDLELTSLKVGAKEFAPETLISLTPGAFTKIGSGASTRYKIDLAFVEAAWRAPLSNYESDNDIYIDALAEIRAEISANGTPFDDTIIETLSPSLTGGTSQTDAFAFTDLAQSGSATSYALTAQLAFPGRASQNVSLSRSFLATWNGSSFSISSLSGAASGQGADETGLGKWRSTLAINSVTGTASGVTVSTTTSASSVSGDALIVPIADFEVIGAEISDTLDPQVLFHPGLYDPTYYLLEIETTGSSPQVPIDDLNNAEAIEIELASMVGVYPELAGISSVALDHETQSIIFFLSPGHEIISAKPVVAPLNVSTPTTLNNTPQAGTVTLELAADADGATYRKTSETFILRTEKHMIPAVAE